MHDIATNPLAVRGLPGFCPAVCLKGISLPPALALGPDTLLHAGTLANNLGSMGPWDHHLVQPWQRIHTAQQRHCTNFEPFFCTHGEKSTAKGKIDNQKARAHRGLITDR